MEEVHFAHIGIDDIVLSVIVGCAIELDQRAEVPIVVYTSAAQAARTEINLSGRAVERQALERNRSVRVAEI